MIRPPVLHPSRADDSGHADERIKRQKLTSPQPYGVITRIPVGVIPPCWPRPNASSCCRCSLRSLCGVENEGGGRVSDDGWDDDDAPKKRAPQNHTPPAPHRGPARLCMRCPALSTEARQPPGTHGTRAHETHTHTLPAAPTHHAAGFAAFPDHDDPPPLAPALNAGAIGGWALTWRTLNGAVVETGVGACPVWNVEER